MLRVAQPMPADLGLQALCGLHLDGDEDLLLVEGPARHDVLDAPLDERLRRGWGGGVCVMGEVGAALWECHGGPLASVWAGSAAVAHPGSTFHMLPCLSLLAVHPPPPGS